MKQFRYLGLILLLGIGSLGMLAPAHAQWYPGSSPYSLRPYTSSISGTVIVNTGNQLVVRTSQGDLSVYLQPQTTIMGVNNILLPLSAIGTGSQVEIYGSVVGGGVVASSIMVISSSLYGGGFVVPPIIYQDFIYDWPTFVRRHPHDWHRWSGHWQRFHRERQDRDGRDHRWNRDGRWDGRGDHSRQMNMPRQRFTPRGAQDRGDLFDRLERRQHERRNINR